MTYHSFKKNTVIFLTAKGIWRREMNMARKPNRIGVAAIPFFCRRQMSLVHVDLRKRQQQLT